MTTQRARSAANQCFPERTIADVTDLNQGRGVFSAVLRVEFHPQPGAADAVAVKLAVVGANGDAARRSGAYEREAFVYQDLLPHLDVRVPICHAVIEDDLGPTLVLEDLSSHRRVDQLDGLAGIEAMAVASALGRLHASGLASLPLADSTTNGVLRTNTVATLDTALLRSGLTTLTTAWEAAVTDEERAAFTQLVDRHHEIAERFAAAGPPVLCHGDPRADNLVFADEPGHPQPILFDWQQVARQPGVGDLAWLAATSLEPAVRRDIESDLVSVYEHASGIDVGSEAFRIGFALPGLAVLYLAQRQTSNKRTTAFIATSLHRIGRALVDLDVATLGRS